MRRLSSICFVAGLVLCASAIAGAQRVNRPPVRRVPIEQPTALRQFYRGLRALERREQRQVRVLHYGDSNVAADLWTMVAREALQARFGNGGSGYLLPPGHGSWNRGPVRVASAVGWATRRRGFGRDFGPNDGRWGLAGVAVEPVGPAQPIRVRVPAGPRGRVFQLHVTSGRGRVPGAVELTVDRSNRHLVHTSFGDDAVIDPTPLSADPHVIQIRHARGRPRLLGMSVEHPSGVVYDVLGINGHRASAILHWDLDLLGEQIAARPADLVILSYGGNEALDPHLSLETYEQQTAEAVRRMRALVPRASCLLVGPLASYPQYAERMRAVTEIQRRLAARSGCGFWDSAALSGGAGTLPRWARYEGMVGGDHLHLGRAGYEMVGRAFVDALLRRY